MKKITWEPETHVGALGEKKKRPRFSFESMEWDLGVHISNSATEADPKSGLGRLLNLSPSETQKQGWQAARS